MAISLEADRRAYQRREALAGDVTYLGSLFYHPAIKEHLIGLWRFRELGQRRGWCATYEMNGHYYDVTCRRTPQAALREVLHGVQRLTRRGATG